MADARNALAQAMFGVGGGRKHKPQLSKIIFDKHDTNKDGKIDAGEFRALVYGSGYYLSDEELKGALRIVDKDGNNTIEYNEFKAWWSQDDRFEALRGDSEQGQERAVAFETFQKFDKDSSGTIDREEFDSFYEDMTSKNLTRESKENAWQWLSEGKNFIGFNRYVQWTIKQQSRGVKTLLTDANLMKATAARK